MPELSLILVLQEQIRKLPDFDNKWDPDLTISYFATMGGFCLDDIKGKGELVQHSIMGSELISEEVCQSPQAREQVPSPRTLSARGLLELYKLQPGYWHQFSAERIKNLSKGSPIFEKCVVIIQASWMVLQVLGRAGSGLPVTALEIHTVAHVVCGVSMYLM